MTEDTTRDTVDLQYAEDLAVGTRIGLGTWSPTETEILEFARQWDPQDHHIDHAAAEAGFFGGIIASGIHTMAILQRLLVDGFLTRVAVVAGRGIDHLAFPAPVRPDDVLTGEVTVTAVRPGRPGRADVTTRLTLTNQHDTVVLDMTAVSVIARRDTDASGARTGP